jgi:hypothetical protein
MTYEEVVKLILDKGDIQVSEKERNLNFQNVKNDIANIIVEKTYNLENGLPFTHNVILKVLNDINFNLKESEDAKKQALKAIKLIQEKDILPIERKMMQIFITIKNQKSFSENFEEFKTYRNIQISTKYVGSVLHYLIRDTFKVSPPMIKEVLALMNFYRNYKIFNEQIEKKGNDVFSSDITYRDIDELSRNLVPENTISNFFTVNQKWCDSIKKYIYQWSINLAKGIRIKYSRTDKNLDKITKNTKTEKTGNNG